MADTGRSEIGEHGYKQHQIKADLQKDKLYANYAVYILMKSSLTGSFNFTLPIQISLADLNKTPQIIWQSCSINSLNRDLKKNSKIIFDIEHRQFSI